MIIQKLVFDRNEQLPITARERPNNDQISPEEMVNSVLDVYNECVQLPNTNTVDRIDETKG